MNNVTNKNSKVEINCSGLICLFIFLAFFFAKIFDKIDWSWWWVFSPLWIPFAIIVTICLIYLVAIIIGLIWK